MSYIDQYLSDCHVTIEAAMRTQCWPDWHWEEHTPDFNRLYFILGGEGELVVDGKAYYPRAGELFLMPAGRPQSFRALNDRPFYKYWCHFRAESHESRLFDILHTPLSVRVDCPEALTVGFESMIACFRSPRVADRLRAKSAMLDILAIYLEQVGEDALVCAPHVPSSQLNLLSEYITNHLREKITLESLASLLHFHPNYFIRFFRKYYGTSPLKYVSILRIEKAKTLLSATNQPVAAIAEETGFCSLYHFSKRFKEQTGFSPSDFREINR